MLRRFTTLLRKEFLQLLHDRLSLKLLVVLPILQLLLIGPALNKEVKHAAFVVLDRDHSTASIWLIQKFIRHGNFSYVGNVNDQDQLEESLRTGNAMLGLEFPAGFARTLELAQDDGADTSRLRMVLDGQDATTAQIVAGYALALVNQWTQEQLARRAAQNGLEPQDLSPVRIFDRILFNPSLESSWYMVPGMAAMLVTMVIALVASFCLVREREAGTLEQLLVTPVGLGEVLLGKLLPYWLVGTAEFMLVLQVARFVFGIPLAGSAWHLLLLVICYSLSSVALGLCIGTFVRTRQQALFLIYFFMVFFILTSGFLMPVESMPEWTRCMTLANATRHFLMGVREILLRGAELSDLSGEFAWIGGIAASLLALAWWRFGRQTD